VGPVEQDKPGTGQVDSGPRAHEQLRADLPLQAGDAAREWGLGHVQPGRGPAEMPLFGHRDEAFKLAYIDGHHSAGC
jgi:hypothetical protein